MWEPNLTPAPNLGAVAAEGPVFRIVDAVYGPPLGEAMPLAYNHRLPQELQRRCSAQLAELLVRPLFLPAGSLNSIFSDPAPLITKELRIAVASPRNEVHVATFNEVRHISHGCSYLVGSRYNDSFILYIFDTLMYVL